MNTAQFFFYCLLIDGHLSCFFLLAIVLCVAMNWFLCVWTNVLNFLGYVPREELLDFIGTEHFEELSNFSKAPAPFYNPTHDAKGPTCPCHTFYCLFITTIFVGGKSYFVTFICISLITNDVSSFRVLINIHFQCIYANIFLKNL
jgi:hypothetical protein